MEEEALGDGEMWRSAVEINYIYVGLLAFL